MTAIAGRIFETAASARCPDRPRLELRHQRLILTIWLIATDALSVSLAFSAAFWIRFDLGLTLSPEVTPDHFYPSLGAMLVLLFVMMFALFRLYEPRNLLGGIGEYERVFHACTTATMAVIVAIFARHAYVVSRLWLLAGCLLSFTLVSTGRFCSRRAVYALRKRGYFLVPAVLVGTNEEAVSLAPGLCDWRSSGLRMIGMVSGDSHSGGCPSGLPLLGSTRDIARIIAEQGVEELIVAATALRREELLRLGEVANGLQGVQMRLSSGLYELLTTRVSAASVGVVPLITLSKLRLEPQELYLKTVIEYLCVLLGIVFLWPLLLAIAVMIKLDSHGPVIHRRRVLGVSGRQFDALKFRTMYVDGDELLSRSPELVQELRRNHKLKDDPRVTRVGHWLRRYSLDELPQLFNVLLGQMGLVGPRMITAAEAEKYGRHILNLLTVKPGITGLWQVSGRSDVSYEDRVKLDMYYIRNYSLWLDLQILFVQTPPAVLRRRGAY